jgi:hypothetical protein
LHVLSTPPAFVLSQDQTLHRDPRTAERPGNLRELASGLLSPSANWHQDGYMKCCPCLMLDEITWPAPERTDRARTSFWLSSVPFSRSVAAVDTRLRRRRCRTAFGRAEESRMTFSVRPTRRSAWRFNERLLRIPTSPCCVNQALRLRASNRQPEATGTLRGEGSG